MAHKWCLIETKAFYIVFQYMIILQLAVIFAFLGLGELTVTLTGLPLPSSIVGMLALTLALQLRIVRLRWVNGAAEILTRNIGFFFIPAGVSLMLHFDIIARHWMPIVVASVVSTILVLFITGTVHQLSRKAFAHSHKSPSNENA